jgi:hypothetical protein
LLRAVAEGRAVDERRSSSATGSAALSIAHPVTPFGAARVELKLPNSCTAMVGNDDGNDLHHDMVAVFLPLSGDLRPVRLRVSSAAIAGVRPSE